MQNHDMWHPITLVLISVFLTSCASTNVPSRWLPEAEQSPSSRYGAWVEVKSREGQVMGELIAINDDTVFVADDMLHVIGSADILSARLVAYDESSLGGYAFLGTVSTLSNGVLLIFTAPMWLIGGSIAASSRSYDPIIDYPNKPLKDFVPFARYPQGLHTDLNRDAIKMKAPE